MLKTKIIRFISVKQVLALVGLSLLVFMSQTHPLIAQSVTQGYNSDEALQRGMIVMLKKGDTGKVNALTTEQVTSMQGVVVSANDSPITISATNQKVYVATSGKFLVLVTDQNGPIAVGDYITISALGGIGMKTGLSQALVLGRALEPFDAKSRALSTAKIKDNKGKEQSVNIGLISTDISIVRNPSLKVEAHVPDVLRKASESVAQKSVGANRIYIGMIILMLTAVIAGVVLYAGVRSSIIALGRNPLSRKTIVRSLIQVIITSLIIFLVGLFGVYLLLKL
jgi:hypothetical protein